jgi:hypothetical protein
MGHENEQTTDRHYGTISNELCIELLEGMGADDPIDLRAFPDEAKVALVDEIIERFGDRLLK